jgi:hypothetical protein
MATLKLANFDSKGIQSLDLQDILTAMDPFGLELRWSILWIRGTPLSEAAQIESEVFADETGLVTSWHGLMEVGNQYVQIDDMWAVGTTANAPLPHRQRETDPTYTFVIEMVDSTYWLVSGNDERLMHQLAQRFGTSAEWVG